MSVNLDIDKIKACAGKTQDSKSSNKQTGVINLNEGARISGESFTRNKKKVLAKISSKI